MEKENSSVLKNASISNESDNYLKLISVGFILSTISMLAFFGNLLVVLAVITNKQLRTVTNYFVASLAVSDLLLAGFVMPFHVFMESNKQIWIFGNIVCNIWISLDVMLCTASILNLCAISVDRYFAITKPLKYTKHRSKKLASLMITLVWILAIFITCPPVFGWRETKSFDRNECRLTQSPGYIIYSAVGSFYLPLVIILFVYIRIFHVAASRDRNLRMESGFSSKSENSCKNNSLSNNEENNVNSGDNLMNRRENLKKQRQVERFRMSLMTSTTALRDIAAIQARARKNPISGNIYILKNEKSKERAVLLKERKAAKTLAVVVGCFSICWLPFFLIYIIEPFCKACQVPILVATCATWLGYFNSLLNPFIYSFYNRDFRYSFYHLTIGKCRQVFNH